MVSKANFLRLTAGIVTTIVAFASSGWSAAQTTIEVNDDQTLTIADLTNGAFQGTNFDLGPTTTFEINQGGRIGNIGSTTTYGELDFLGSTVDVNDGGIFGLCINPNCGVVKNLSLNVYDGGRAFMTLQTGSGTVVNIFGGSISNSILDAGSEVYVRAGSVGGDLIRARPGSVLNISGGRFRNFDVQSGSDVTLVGGDFRLNGAQFTDPAVSLVSGDVFSGVLSDGSIFIIDPSTNLSYSNIKLDTVPLPNITMNNFVIDGTEVLVPQNLRDGQSLELHHGGALNSLFFARGASVDIQGGSVGVEARVVDSIVKISGGVFGDRFQAFYGSTVDITGGDFAGWPWAREGSTWNIRGGSFGGIVAFGGSEVNVSGGSFEHDVQTYEDSVLNIRGGSFDEILAYGGTINLYVKSASLSGLPLGLESGTPKVVSERDFDSYLDVVLADGTPLSMSLAPDYGKPPSPFVHPDANLFVILVPEPNSVGLWLLSVVFIGLCRRRCKK